MLAKSASIAVLGAVTLLSLSGCSSAAAQPDGSRVDRWLRRHGGLRVAAPRRQRGCPSAPLDVGKGEGTVGVVLAGTAGRRRTRRDTDAELLTQALEARWRHGRRGERPG